VAPPLVSIYVPWTVIREQRGFVELVAAARSDEASPVLKIGLPIPHALRQVEGPHLLADYLRVEERFGFESHLLGDGFTGKARW
jgi:hypothetical protein